MTNSLTQSFATAYADAVVDYVVLGAAQEVYFDNQAGAFRHAPVEPGTAPDDVDLFVGSTWPQVVGYLGVERHQDSERFSPDLLRRAIVQALSDAPTAKKLSLYLVDAARSPGQLG